MCTAGLIIISSRFRVRIAFGTKNNKSERLPLKPFWRWKVGQDSCFKAATLAVLLYKTINNSISTRETSAERRTCWKPASTPGRAPRRPLLSADSAPGSAPRLLAGRYRPAGAGIGTGTAPPSPPRSPGPPLRGRAEAGRAGPGGGEEPPALPIGRAGGRAGPLSGLGAV